jgi:hypothetical protein
MYTHKHTHKHKPHTHTHTYTHIYTHTHRHGGRDDHAVLDDDEGILEDEHIQNHRDGAEVAEEDAVRRGRAHGEGTHAPDCMWSALRDACGAGGGQRVRPKFLYALVAGDGR